MAKPIPPKAIVSDREPQWLKKCEECGKEHHLGIEHIFCDNCRKKKR
jgi:hypothetical protein